MALFTYLFAFGHFSTELFIFKTARINTAVLSPVLVSSRSSFPPTVIPISVLTHDLLPSALSLIWMLNQYDFYVQS